MKLDPIHSIPVVIFIGVLFGIILGGFVLPALTEWVGSPLDHILNLAIIFLFWLVIYPKYIYHHIFESRKE